MSEENIMDEYTQNKGEQRITELNAIISETVEATDEYSHGSIQAWGISLQLLANANGTHVLLQTQAAYTISQISYSVKLNKIIEAQLVDNKTANNIDSTVFNITKMYKERMKNNADYYISLAEWAYSANYGGEYKLKCLLKRFGNLMLDYAEDMKSGKF